MSSWDLIGVGAMGAVYAAYDPELDRRARSSWCAPTQGRTARPPRPVASSRGAGMAQLTHPNVVSIFDVGTFDAGLFLAMESSKARTLTDWLSPGAENGRRPCASS